MTALDKMAVGLEIGNGETIVCTLHAQAEVSEKAGRNPGSTVYSVPVVLEDGRQTVLRGGARLIIALQDALHGKSGIQKISVTARGAAGTTERQWEIKTV